MSCSVGVPRKKNALHQSIIFASCVVICFGFTINGDDDHLDFANSSVNDSILNWRMLRSHTLDKQICKLYNSYLALTRAGTYCGDGRLTYGASCLLREQTLTLFVFGRVRYRMYARERAG
jgi:hypothetical protein